MRRALTNVATGLSAIGLMFVAWALLSAEGELRAPPRHHPPDFGAPTHIVVITVDTLRADHVGVDGAEGGHTPNIDRLARRGVVFRQATVPIPRTTPALASLMTGLGPAGHGSTEVGERMQRVPTLAGVLQRAGFQTVGVSANGAAGRRQGFARGFDTFISSEMKRGQRGVKKQGFAVTKKVAELLDNLDVSRPVFLWAHYVDPHWPYAPPKHVKDQPGAPACRALVRETKRRALSRGGIMVNAGGVAAEALADCKALYAAEVEYADAQVGRVIALLEERGMLDHTLVVVTADHGENLGEDGYYYDHGPSLNDASLRVPLVMAGPGTPRGRVDDEVTRMEDLAPTVLQLADVPPDAWPAMVGQPLAWRWNREFGLPDEHAEVALAYSASALQTNATLFVVSGRQGGKWCVNGERYSLCRGGGLEEPAFFDREEDPELRSSTSAPPEVAAALAEAANRWGAEGARSRCARTPLHKLVQYPRLDGEFDEALFDLRGDPGETVNLIAKHPDEAARLRDALRAGSTAFGEGRRRSREDVEALRSLGYIQ